MIYIWRNLGLILLHLLFLFHHLPNQLEIMVCSPSKSGHVWIKVYDPEDSRFQSFLISTFMVRVSPEYLGKSFQKRELTIKHGDIIWKLWSAGAGLALTVFVCCSFSNKNQGWSWCPKMFQIDPNCKFGLGRVSLFFFKTHIMQTPSSDHLEWASIFQFENAMWGQRNGCWLMFTPRIL